MRRSGLWRGQRICVLHWTYNCEGHQVVVVKWYGVSGQVSGCGHNIWDDVLVTGDVSTVPVDAGEGLDRSGLLLSFC